MSNYWNGRVGHFLAGYEAYYVGKSSTDNPYLPDTQDGADWDAGWWAARNADLDTPYGGDEDDGRPEKLVIQG